MANKPNIRFKGFTDDWEQRKFGDVVQRQSDIIVSDENYLCVEYEDVISNQGELNKDLHTKHVSKSGVKFSSEDVLYGKLRPYLHNWLNPDFDGVAVGDWWVLKPISLNKNFLYTLIQTPIYDAIANQSSGTKMPRADWKLVSNTYFDMPLTLLEQEKIAYYFSTLDHLITLHQRKCDETKKLKKFMLQKMFPKNGEKNPEIRFAGFTDAWEQRKFDELFTGLQNNTLSRSELNYENGTLMDVHYGDILVKFGEYIDVSKHQLPYINDATIANKYDGSFLKDGDIIIADTAEDSTVGKCTEILGANNYLLISGLHTIPCRPMIKFASKYLGYYMNSSAYRKQLIPLMQGIKVTSISKSSIYDTKLIFPKSISEQAKIGEYFSTLDHLITLHQRKCDKLKLIKKFMLQNMFPKKG